MTTPPADRRPQILRLPRTIEWILFGDRKGAIRLVDRRKIILIHSLCGLASLSLIFFGGAHLVRGSGFLGFLDIAASAVFMSLPLVLRLTGRFTLVAYIGLLFFGLFMLYHISRGGAQPGMFLWVYAYPSVVAFMLGNRRAIPLSAIFIAIIALILFFPGTPFLLTPYPLSFKVRFFASYGIVTVIAVLFEAIRNNAEKSSIEKTLALERAIMGLKETEQALRRSEQAQKALADQLIRSNRELQDFAHTASHDLQEPLRKITAFSDLLNAKHSNALDDQGRDYLTRIQSATRRMSGLIESLLAYSRATLQGRPFERVDLGVILSEVISDLEVRIAESHGCVISKGLPVLEADPAQMRQLLQNLVGNALKYHRPGIAPTVSVTGAATETTTTVLVEDNGIGFEQDDAERIFGIFQRLHGRSSAFEGSGIGLSVCRKILERHNGTIAAEGKPNEGARFIITMPLRQATKIEFPR